MDIRFKEKTPETIIDEFCKKNKDKEEVFVVVAKCFNENLFITDSGKRYVYDISLVTKMWMDSIVEIK